jgi:hypothetical protein
MTPTPANVEQKPAQESLAGALRLRERLDAAFMVVRLAAVRRLESATATGRADDTAG